MELRVFWTDTARFQLEDIFLYYKDKANLRVTRKLVKGIIDRTIQLEKNPNSGPNSHFSPIENSNTGILSKAIIKSSTGKRIIISRLLLYLIADRIRKK